MSLGDSARIMLSMIELEVRRITHDRSEIYSRAVQPLLWLIVFGYVLGSFKAIPTGGLPYMDYIMPGVLMQSTMSVSIFFGLILICERESGILKKLFTAPAPSYAIVIGRAMAAGVRSLAQAVIILAFALILGIKVILNPAYLLAAFAIVFVSSGGFAGISIMIATFLKTREKFMGIGQAVILPLFFTSSALYPISAMPEILQFFARINPMTYAVDAVRALTITGDLTNLPADFAAILIFDIVIFALASASFKKVIE